MTASAINWVPPHSRIRLQGSGTPAAANFSAAMKEYDPVNFIVCAQGNHHPTYGRMDESLSELYHHVSKPFPVYKGNPAGLEHALEVGAAWERRHTGAPATKENFLAVKDQGRFVLGVGELALKRYLKVKELSGAVPQLRWRVTDMHMDMAGVQPSDYDETARDVVGSMKKAVRRAGGPEGIGMFYLCSPNNPTGRRFTEEEYHAIMTYADEINEIRVGQGLPKMVVFIDNPYFEACPLRHKDLERANTGTDPYLETGYPFAKRAYSSPVVIMHSMSKFAEQAGTSGFTFVTSTDPEFTKVFKDVLTAYGALAYDQDFMDMVARVHAPQNDPKLLKRYQQVGELFQANSDTMEEIFGAHVLQGGPNMVRCVRVPFEEYMGCEVIYPDGEKVVIKNVSDLVETMGNFFGVGAVAEKDDGQIFSEGYDSDNESLIRYALNEDPERFRVAMERSESGLTQIAECVRAGRPLQYTPVEGHSPREAALVL